MSRNNLSKTERRRIVWQKTGGICAHCGNTVYGNHQTIDHFIPKSLGGGFDMRNLVPLCRACNMQRHSNDIDPAKFYSYAPKTVISDCMTYKRIWTKRHSNMHGDVFLD